MVGGAYAETKNVCGGLMRGAVSTLCLVASLSMSLFCQDQRTQRLTLGAGGG